MRLEATTEAALGRAFGLAYFIHADRSVALEIVRRAASKLQVAAAAQGKRLYYRPIGRPRPAAGTYRNKVSFGEIHLLQRLVYIESESFELESEAGAAPPGAGAMLVRYIKHLVRLTTRRNSFYVTLGLARLLYNYTTAETMELYNTVIQDPERVKDDYYYRSRKGVLMQEMKARFGELLEVTRRPRGEERFQSRAASAGDAALVRRSLEMFTPWETACTLPCAFNPILDELPDLTFRGLQEEDHTEVNRLHTVLHPACFRRLAEALKLPAPDERLEVPHFALSRDQMGPPGEHPPGMTPEELSAIQHSLSEQAGRRKAAGAGLLRVLVDGAERARLHPPARPRARFELTEKDELIELHSADGEVLLATHLLRREGDKLLPAAASIVLEGGQKIAFTIAEVEGRPSAEIRYRAGWGFALAALLSRARWRAASAPVLAPVRLAAIALFCILLALAGLLYLRRERSEEPRDLVARRTEETTPPVSIEPERSRSQPPEPSPPAGADTAATTRRAPERTPPARPPRASSGSARGEADETTRGLDGGRTTRTELSQLKLLYVEITGDERVSEELRLSLAGRLRTSGRFVLTENRDTADALLRVSLSRGVAAARLINPRGEVVWAGGRQRFTSAERAAEALAGELLRAAR